jgi:hypothetical protein
MTHLDRAIAIVEDARQTHVEAIDWLTEHRRTAPQWARISAALEGGVSFHRRCVRDYDFVLKVLRRFARRA